MRMSDKAKAGSVEPPSLESESLGARLALLRWAKASQADRKAQGKKMAAGRKKARRKRGAK